jgi:hypothetical protein
MSCSLNFNLNNSIRHSDEENSRERESFCSHHCEVLPSGFYACCKRID